MADKKRFNVHVTRADTPDRVEKTHFVASTYNEYRREVNRRTGKDWMTYEVYYGSEVVEGSSVRIRDETFYRIFPDSRPKR
jgi:hypothetical protein